LKSINKKYETVPSIGRFALRFSPVPIRSAFRSAGTVDKEVTELTKLQDTTLLIFDRLLSEQLYTYRVQLLYKKNISSEKTTSSSKDQNGSRSSN
jgi:hypothetical protein